MDSPLIFLISGWAIGVLMGGLAYRQLFSRRVNTRKRIQALERLQQDYLQNQDAVREHYLRTGELVAQLNQNAHELCAHLKRGADALDLDLPRAEHPSPYTDCSAPKDYAPRNDRLPGTLSESYGQAEA